jgi:hypothetical protein
MSAATTILGPRRQVARRLGTFCAAASIVALTACATPARADFDQTLATKVAPAVLKYLRDNGYRTVGVLKFRVKRGNEPETFYVGPLNDNMAARLENALIYKSDETDTLEFLQNPSAEAARQKQHLSYLKPAGREKLLELEYPLAFGDEAQRVKPDVFLTGLVELRPLEHKAIVSIEAFGKKSKDLTKMGSFELPLDPAMLVDAGMSFDIIKSLAPSDAAAADAAGNSPKAIDESLLAMTILYDNKTQVVKKDGAASELSVAEPKEGQDLVFRIKNNAKERLGVVLLVNGQSTYRKQRGLPTAAYKKWMLDPGDGLDINGFSVDDEVLEHFVVRPDMDWRKLMESEELSACNLGTFELYIFRESDGIAADKEQMPFSLGMRARPTQRAKSLNEARSNIRKAMSPQALGPVEPDSSKTSKDKVVHVPGFKNPQLVTSRIIRYYHPKMRQIAD